MQNTQIQYTVRVEGRIFEGLKLPMAFKGLKRAKIFLCATTQPIRKDAVGCWIRVILPAGKDMPFCPTPDIGQH